MRGNPRSLHFLNKPLPFFANLYALLTFLHRYAKAAFHHRHGVKQLCLSRAHPVRRGAHSLRQCAARFPRGARQQCRRLHRQKATHLCRGAQGVIINIQSSKDTLLGTRLRRIIVSAHHILSRQPHLPVNTSNILQ